MTENTRSAILKEAEHIVNGNRELNMGTPRTILIQ